MKTKSVMVAAIIFFMGTGAFAQTGSGVTFGIRAGVNFQNLNGKNVLGDKLDNKLKTGFHVGANAEIPVATDFYLQPGVLFSTKGAKYDAVDDSKVNLSYIEVPVNFIYKPVLGDGKLLLGFGPYAAFAVSGNFKVGDNKTDLNFGSNDDDDLKGFDAGANFLAGYEFSNKLSFQLNAGLGLLNIANRTDGDTKSVTKNTGFGVSLGYRF